MSWPAILRSCSRRPGTTGGHSVGLPVVCYQSMLREVASTVSSFNLPTAGRTVASLHDLKAYTSWQAGTLTPVAHIDIDAGAGKASADYCALIDHNVTKQNKTDSVPVLRADDVFPPTTLRYTFTGTLTDPGQVDIRFFSNLGPFRYWRLDFQGGAGPDWSRLPFIGEFWLGLRTTLPGYLTAAFDPFFSSVEVKGSSSVGGHYLAGLNRGKTHRGSLEFGRAGVPRSELTSYLNAFITYAEKRQPFLFVVDPDDEDFDTARYLKIPDAARITRKAIGGGTDRFDVMIPVEEAYMELVTT